MRIDPLRRYWIGQGASTRVANALATAQIGSVEALRAAGPAVVIRLRGIGGLSIVEIARIAGWDSISTLAPPVTVAKVENMLDRHRQS